MATGWAREGAVQEQIDDTVKDGVLRAKSRLPQGRARRIARSAASRFPEARRAALAGVQLCVVCQQKADAEVRQFSGYNRRGSKDSQLR